MGVVLKNGGCDEIEQDLCWAQPDFCDGCAKIFENSTSSCDFMKISITRCILMHFQSIVMYWQDINANSTLPLD